MRKWFLKLVSLVVLTATVGCASIEERQAISKADAIRIAADFAKVPIDSFDVDARFDQNEWLVLFDSKSNIVGDHFWVFVRADGTVRRLTGGG